MKRFLFLVSAFVLFPSLGFAGGIEGLSVTPAADGRNLFISWSALGNDVLSGVDGYGLQWSIYKNNVAVDKSARQFLGSQQNSLTVRAGGFERNQDYYFRVYTYVKDGRKRVLGNGSKLLKWKWPWNGDVITSEEVVVDPVLAGASGSSGGSSLGEFGIVRPQALDTFIDFAWSRPRKLTSSDYDGFHIVLSTNSDMSKPVAVLETARTFYRGRIKGLLPATQYYARGYFYKNRGGEAQRFGEGTKKMVKTIAAVNRDGRSRAARNIKKLEKKALPSVTVGGEGASSSSAASNTSSSSSSSSSGSSSASSSSTSLSSSSSNVTSSAGIRAKISDLQKEIKKLQQDLKTWQKKLRSSKTSSRGKTRSSGRSSTRSRSSSRSWTRVRSSFDD